MTDEPTITTPSGRVRGLARAGHQVFYSIPYAEAPVGDLRLAPPAPVRPWEGIRGATAYGPTPARTAVFGLIPEPVIAGDDTLNATVFTPAADPAAKLPVLVWIHGGGYTGGSPASPWYDGASFARDGIVTVVISYRLGFDGFGVIPGTPANRAVRDWLAALEWVQTHIHAFGGDADRVTIAGQSAGGGAVLTLLSLPAAQPLFRAVWASSAVLPVHTLSDATKRTERLADRLHVAATRVGLASVPEAQITAEQGAAARVRGRSLSRMIDEAPPYGPVVDGDLIAVPTLEAIAGGVGRDKALILGSNDHEIGIPAEELPSWLRLIPPGLALRATGLHGNELRAYRAGRLGAGSGDVVDAVEQEITDRVFRRLVVRIAEARRAVGATTRAYRFSWPSPVRGGAIHCVDVPFFWDVLDELHVPQLLGHHPPQELADAFHGAAVAHITGDMQQRGDSTHLGDDWPVWDAERTVAWIGGGERPVEPLAHGYISTASLL